MKFSTDDFRKACGHRTVGECRCNFGAEEKALNALVDAFAEAMTAKLLEKCRRGSGGWDDPEWSVHDIVGRIREHIEKGDVIDVANFCAFLWNRQ